MEKHLILSSNSPPPPPPLPSQSPSVDAFSRCVQKRVIMRKFNWDTIPCERVIGRKNLWTMQASLDNFELDTDRIKELFSNIDIDRSKKSAIRPLVFNISAAEQEIQKKPVSLLGSKKSMNIAILLKQFKRPIYRLVRDIREGNSLAFKSGTLRELLNLLPEKEEAQKLLAYDDILSNLVDADQFMVRLVRLPGYKERIQGLALKEDFFSFMDDLRKLIVVMTTASKELFESDDLQSIIHLVLKVGNYMNEGCYTGSAIGFKVASLLRLADTKANEPGRNLMHYVAMQAQDIDPFLLSFPQRLKHIKPASRINALEVQADLKREISRVARFKDESSRHDDLKSQMEHFLKRADLTLADMDKAWREFQYAKTTLAEYLCEDPISFKLEECCCIFTSFSEKFEQAVKENQRWEEDARENRKGRGSLACQGRSLSAVSETKRAVLQQDSDIERALTSLLIVNRSDHKRRRNLHQSPVCVPERVSKVMQEQSHKMGR